jgi:hypothetical protein
MRNEDRRSVDSVAGVYQSSRVWGDDFTRVGSGYYLMLLRENESTRARRWLWKSPQPLGRAQKSFVQMFYPFN